MQLSEKNHVFTNISVACSCEMCKVLPHEIIHEGDTV